MKGLHPRCLTSYKLAASRYLKTTLITNFSTLLNCCLSLGRYLETWERTNLTSANICDPKIHNTMDTCKNLGVEILLNFHPDRKLNVGMRPFSFLCLPLPTDGPASK